MKNELDEEKGKTLEEISKVVTEVCTPPPNNSSSGGGGGGGGGGGSSNKQKIIKQK